MVKKIIISYFNNIAAILLNNKIQEIVITNNRYQVNDIYIGMVQKVFSSINAAFIKLGKYGKSGFIHISDIKCLKKDHDLYHISDILSINQLLLVQVIKEPTYSKGPRLSANIHLHGKYIILMPLCNTILISHKIINNNERIYLYSLAVLIKPQLMGILFKSSAQGVSEVAILRDLDSLMKQWYFIQKMVILLSSPTLIYKDEDLVKKVMRDFYENSVKKIIVDSEISLKLIYYYLKKWSYVNTFIQTQLQLYNNHDSILEKFLIKKTIKESLKSKVHLLYGGYIIIESYEALTIIDVNSGSFNQANNSQDMILRTNFYAAMEIAYQLKVRNINGVIVIDFIDMSSQQDQFRLLEHFNKFLILDDAKPQIVQLSQLGLLELTRRRRGQSLKELFASSNVRQYYNMNSYRSNRLYFKLLWNISSNHNHLKKKFVVYKSIRSLFFRKKFDKKRILCNKYFCSTYFSYSKYFVFIDNLYTMFLFNPRANYMIPLLLYSKLMKYRI
uniref:Ribonuclease E n=1 Tax=Lophocladia kuetzingii TaxID=675577 RepID=A0A1Z1MNQ5_9FLOR|nr:ribonuclease E [Lophocladia kuetzingii]ARW67566.1 ribonuclease E [Lophocladia kuetzingii]